MAGLPIRVIVGLGNPGPEHQVTRHNAGFWFVDLLARTHGAEFRDYRKYSGETARVTIGGHEVILLKPTTYMNRSGLSVRQVSDFFKIAPDEVNTHLLLGRLAGSRSGVFRSAKKSVRYLLSIRGLL